MTGMWPHGTARLLLRELAGPEGGSAFVDWAVRALSDGYDCQSLGVLAGLDAQGIPSGFEAAAKFRVALRELGIPDVDPPTLMCMFAREVAHGILEGALAPQDGVALIHREVISPFEHPHHLQAWCDLWEELDPATGTPLEGDALIRAIYDTARAWTSGAAEQGDAPDEVRVGHKNRGPRR